MIKPAEETIVQNLVQALQQLHRDLDKVELWAAALGTFQSPVPEYQPSSQHLLPVSPRREARSHRL
jgi:hypothetical protein